MHFDLARAADEQEPSMKRRDLQDGLMKARQAMLEALLGINGTLGDGARDAEDGAEIAQALERLNQARDGLDLVGKRLRFLHELERLRGGSSSSSGRWHTVSLVRLGVDCGYAVEDVNRLVEAAMSIAGKGSRPPAEGPASPPST